MHRLLVLGATGSVGRSTLDVAARHPDKLEVRALVARRDVEGMVELVGQFRPEAAVMAEADAAAELRRRLLALGLDTRVLAGAQAVLDTAADGGTDVVMSAIVGGVGLEPTLAAIRAGKRVLIANKEPLVMAGELMIAQARACGATLIPIDSEHNAIFQCLPGDYRCGDRPAGVRRIQLTASGGPFRSWTRSQMAAVTPAQAVRHPNWSMGQKISVDSATMMNKGLERIEAAVLYRMAPQQIEILVHPESVVHSLVEYADGSTLAQMGEPDMRVPIAHALAWPERWSSGVAGLDLVGQGSLHFEKPDAERFPCLRLAEEALCGARNLPNILNAANEIAVEAFLEGNLDFMGIPQVVEQTLEAGAGRPAEETDIESVLASDHWARDWCRQRIGERHRG